MLVVATEGREAARNDRYVDVVVRGLLPASGSRGQSR
jgi:hypothetical protein